MVWVNESQMWFQCVLCGFIPVITIRAPETDVKTRIKQVRFSFLLRLTFSLPKSNTMTKLYYSPLNVCHPLLSALVTYFVTAFKSMLWACRSKESSLANRYLLPVPGIQLYYYALSIGVTLTFSLLLLLSAQPQCILLYIPINAVLFT